MNTRIMRVLIALSLLVIAPIAGAGLIHEIIVTDISGSGLAGRGIIRFSDAVGSCSGAACLTLLDGIEVRFSDGSFRVGDIWGSPNEIVEASWDIDLSSWRLRGVMQLSEKSRISPFLSFTEGFAENRNTGIQSTLEVRPIPEPGSLVLAALGIAGLRIGQKVRYLT